MKNILFIAFVLISFFRINAQPPVSDANPGEIFGEEFHINSQTDIIENFQIEEGETLKGYFSGMVKEVCSKKGCWIKLELPNGEFANIKMKDYGFFVPTELVDKQIFIKGKAELEIISVEELRKSAKAAEKSQTEIEEINSPEKNINILADEIKVKG